MPARIPAPTTLLTLACLALPATVAAQSAAPLRSDQLAAFQPRVVGPAQTGGRVHDLAVVPGDPSTFYVASASGGLWKTTNRGHTWTPVFDTMAVSTLGDVALAPSNPDIVYVGTGEQNNRQSTSWGNGVYRSDDAGRTWRHLGLEETRHIGQIEVHPTNPDVAWVAALGNLWAPSQERGVFRTADGGRTWDKVLFVDEHTGAVDLVMDASNPDVLYAAMYQRLRRAWGFNGGGPGSGIWKSTDGGRTWSELTNGLPSEDKGRIGLAISRTNPRVLAATIETARDETTGTYRTEDGGASWRRVNDLNPRPMYYSHIYIDPTDEDRIYVLGTSSYVSDDAGRTFRQIAERATYDVGVHADHHVLWINPDDPDHLYLAGDAGLHETYDRGARFRKINNFPIAQFYNIGVDMRDPYWIYGGLQDNHSFMGPSQTRHWAGIIDDDWWQTGFGDGMYWDVDPTNFRYAYGSSNGGSYFRLDPLTGDMLDISPQEPPGEEYRFDWTSPLMVSRHDPATVFVAGNRLFTSRDRGVSWERTEDLSKRIDRDTLTLMGVRGADLSISANDGTSSFGEAVTLDESPVDRNVLWVGFDDGNLQVSRDGGRTWTEVSRNVRGIPTNTYVSRIAASTRGPGVAYATFDAHRQGDFAPYVYRTEDFGSTWTPLHQGLPTGSVNEIVEHPDNPSVLFLGTEHHLFVSTDAGRTWAKQPNLPTTAYDDLLVHPREKDLVIGTHGRSIWVLDDTRPLAEWNATVAAAPAHLFSVAQGTLFHYWKDTSYRGNAEWHGQNPPDGVHVTYNLGSGGGPAVLRVTGPDGRTVRTLEVPAAPGMHRVTWDLRHGREDGERERWEPFHHPDPDVARPLDARGPLVSPGVYTLALEARGTTSRQQVEVRGDPLLPNVTLADYQERERFLLDALEVSRRVNALSTRIDRAGNPQMRRELNALSRSAGGLYGDLAGGGVRQGSLLPPTQTMRQELERVRRAVAELERRLEQYR